MTCRAQGWVPRWEKRVHPLADAGSSTWNVRSQFDRQRLCIGVADGRENTFRKGRGPGPSREAGEPLL